MQQSNCSCRCSRFCKHMSHAILSRITFHSSFSYFPLLSPVFHCMFSANLLSLPSSKNILPCSQHPATSHCLMFLFTKSSRTFQISPLYLRFLFQIRFYVTFILSFSSLLPRLYIFLIIHVILCTCLLSV